MHIQLSIGSITSYTDNSADIKSELITNNIELITSSDKNVVVRYPFAPRLILQFLPFHSTIKILYFKCNESGVIPLPRGYFQTVHINEIAINLLTNNSGFKIITKEDIIKTVILSKRSTEVITCQVIGLTG